MESRWSHGEVESCSSGKQLARILLPHPTPRTPPGRRAGVVAAEERKVAKYMCLSAMHTMTPVAIETSGFLGRTPWLF